MSTSPAQDDEQPALGGPNQRFGRAGESRALAWYRARGYRLVVRNWRCREGEIDLIVRRGQTLVFCEVKARRTAAQGTALEAVTARKQAQVRRVATVYLASGESDRRGRIRFDVAAIDAGHLTVVEGAF